MRLCDFHRIQYINTITEQEISDLTIDAIAPTVVADIAVEGEFITTWNTTNPGTSDANTITIHFSDGYPGNHSINWGDGVIENFTSGATTRSHTYASQGIKTIKISGTYVWNPQLTNPAKLLTVVDWGYFSIGSAAFNNCVNLTLNDVIGIPTIIILTNAFTNCGALTQINRVNEWNTTGVTSFSSVFRDCRLFNQDLDNWDTSSATLMSFAFYGAWAFNGNISTWDVTNIPSLQSTFNGARAFNGDLSLWNVGNVTNMFETFRDTLAFTGFSIVNWDVSKVLNFTRTFYGSKITNPTFNWTLAATGNITCYEMFRQANTFNGALEQWNTNRVTNMFGMFQDSSFNQPLNLWDVSNVTNFAYMFYGNSTAFMQYVGDWNVTNGVTFERMFMGRSNNGYNQPLTNWVLGTGVSLSGMFQANWAFNQPLAHLDISGVTNLGGVFLQARGFNQDISSWNVTGVTTFIAFTDNGFLKEAIGFSAANLAAIYTAWSQQAVQPNLTFHAGVLKYSSSGQAGRDVLTGTHGWTIIDGGPI